MSDCIKEKILLLDYVGRLINIEIVHDENMSDAVSLNSCLCVNRVIDLKILNLKKQQREASKCHE